MPIEEGSSSSGSYESNNSTFGWDTPISDILRGLREWREYEEERRRRLEMSDDERKLGEYAIPDVNASRHGPDMPRLNVTNFELRPALITMLQQHQLSGSPTEDANEHIASFLTLSDTVKISGVSTDALRLCLFPFSLRDKAKS